MKYNYNFFLNYYIFNLIESPKVSNWPVIALGMTWSIMNVNIIHICDEYMYYVDILKDKYRDGYIYLNYKRNIFSI